MSTDPLTTMIEALTDDQLEALAVRLAPCLSKMQDGSVPGSPPEVRTSPYATVTEAAEYLNMTRRSVEAHLASGRLTHVKIGMPQNTPRSRWKHWPTRIKWSEVEAFASGLPTGSLAEAAMRARSHVA